MQPALVLVLSMSAARGAATLGWRASPSQLAPPPRSGHAAASDTAGTVWLFGGYYEYTLDLPRHLPIAKERVPTNDLWRYEEIGRYAGGEWACVQPVSPDDDLSRPPPRLCSAAAIVGGELLLFGGWDPRPAGTGGKILADVWALDLASDAWERLADMPGGPTSRHVACTLGDGTLLVHTHRCTAPSPRGLHAAAGLGKLRMVVFGGADQTGAMSNEAFVLDTRTWEWSKVEGAGIGPSPRAGVSAASVTDGSVALFGGAERAPGGGLQPRADTWLLEAERDNVWRWQLLRDDGEAAAGIPYRRNAASLTTLAPAADGRARLLLHGGWDPFVETYDDTHILEL